MLRREILAALRAAVRMDLRIVDLKLLERWECQGLIVGWKGAFHCCSSSRKLFGGLDVLVRMDGWVCGRSGRLGKCIDRGGRGGVGFGVGCCV